MLVGLSAGRPAKAIHAGMGNDVFDLIATIQDAQQQRKIKRGATITSQKSIEIILARQLASSLAMPICIVDTEGTLIFYNEHAEAVLNQRFDETGDMQASEWTALFAVDDMARNPVPIDDWPLVRAYKHRAAVSSLVWLRCRDNAWRNVSFTAFPLIGQNDHFLGALAIFWEV